MKKVLWKIEELWNNFCQDASQVSDTPFFLNDSFYFTILQDFDFTKSTQVVHTDDYGSYHGLLDQQCIQRKKCIYLFDNHNKIIHAFFEIFQARGVFDVVHIDAHRDDAIYSYTKPEELSYKTIDAFVDSTRISDFFDAISGTQMIARIHRICDSAAFLDYKKPEKPFILSLDIDIFGPEGDFVDLDEKVRVIADAWGTADAICIATSPGFIDQEFAEKIIKIMITSQIS